MAEHDTGPAGAHEPGAFDIIQFPAAGKLAADNAGKAGNEQDAQGKDDILRPRAGHGDDDQERACDGVAPKMALIIIKFIHKIAY